MKIDTLDSLKLGEKAIISDNLIKTGNRQNIINLGVSNGTSVKCLYRSPLGDPTAYLVKNVIIAIRKEDAKNIVIERKFNGTY